MHSMCLYKAATLAVSAVTPASAIEIKRSALAQPPPPQWIICWPRCAIYTPRLQEWRQGAAPGHLNRRVRRSCRRHGAVLA